MLFARGVIPVYISGLNLFSGQMGEWFQKRIHYETGITQGNFAAIFFY